MEEYWRQMPGYQGVQLADLQPQRILFGWFPTYRGSPLAPSFNRILQVGDASGIQSPLSFGGFGALTRHLGRLTDGVSEALAVDLLDSRSLALLNAYNPGLSGAWMLQKAMSIGADKRKYSQEFINRLLAENFQVRVLWRWGWWLVMAVWLAGWVAVVDLQSNHAGTYLHAPSLPAILAAGCCAPSTAHPAMPAVLCHAVPATPAVDGPPGRRHPEALPAGRDPAQATGADHEQAGEWSGCVLCLQACGKAARACAGRFPELAGLQPTQCPAARWLSLHPNPAAPPFAAACLPACRWCQTR